MSIFVESMRTSSIYGWSNELVDPDKPDFLDVQSDIKHEALTVPTNRWVNIRSATFFSKLRAFLADQSRKTKASDG